MLVHDGKDEAKLFDHLLASLRATGNFPSSQTAAPSLSAPALVANTRSDVAAAEDALRVAAADARALLSSDKPWPRCAHEMRDASSAEKRPLHQEAGQDEDDPHRRLCAAF